VCEKVLELRWGVAWESDVEGDTWLVGEFLLLNAEDWSVHLIVDPWQVGGGWSLTHAAELVVDGSVAKADPSLVGSEVGHWDAAQMSANGRAAKDGRVSSFRNRDLRLLVEFGRLGESVGLVDL